MNVFVAGGTGVLGRSVLRHLVAKGHRVHALSRNSENERRIRELGAEPAPGTFFETESLATALRGCEAVLHLATKIPQKIRPTRRDFAENDRLRTEGTANLIEACFREGARFYLQQSIAFLAARIDGRLLRDDEPCSLPARPGSVPLAAIQMEEMVHEAHGRYGLSTVILRGGLFYHAESKDTLRMIHAIRKRRLPIFGTGSNIVSLVHVEDMARAVIAVMEQQIAGQTFFVVDDHPLSFGEFIDTIARMIGAKPAPHWPKILARPILGPILGVLPKISFNCSNSKLKQATGWQPQYPDLAAGMKQVLEALGG